MRVGLTTQRPYSIELHPRQPVMLGQRCAIVGSRPGCRRASPRARQSPTPRICSAIESSMSSSLNIARRWDVARWLSIRHRRYGGDLRSNQKDGRQCTEHLRRDRRSAAAKAVPAAGGVPYLHIIVECSTRYAAVVAAGLVLFGLLLPTRVMAQQRASVANDLSVSAAATDGRSHAVAAKPVVTNQ